MALVTTSLAADLKAIFDEMDEHPTSNEWLADQLAAAIDKQTKTATVSVGGVASGSSVATGSLS